MASPEQISFTDTMSVIDENYQYQPTTFYNGKGDDVVENLAGSNEGSCKLFAFAQKQSFDGARTLACFGDYYRIDVLENPQGNDHQNIRNFMKHGWQGIRFDGDALT